MKNSIIKKILSGSLVLAIGAATLAGCGNTATSNAGDTKVTSETVESAESATGTGNTVETDVIKSITISSASDWETFNPILATSYYIDFIADQVFDKLVFAEEDGSATPRLAERWEFDEGDSGITWYLNPNAKFSDGEPVTADDVVFTSQLYSRPDITNTRRSIIANIAGTDDTGVELSEKSVEVEAVDEHTVHMTFKTPYAESYVLSQFGGQFFIYPKHIYEGISGDDFNNPSYWSNPIGSGPYKIVKSIDGAEVDLEANHDYFLGDPDIDYLYVKVYDSANLISALQTGEIDYTEDIPVTDVPTAKEDTNLAVESTPSTWVEAVVINNSDPLLSKKEVRQAINYAIDRQAIVTTLLQGEGVVKYVPYADNSPFFAADVEYPEYNPDKAKELLASAGWDESKTVELQVTTGEEQLAVLVQQYLTAVGINTNIQSYDFTTLISNIRATGEYQLAFMSGISALADPDKPASWLTTNRSYNFAWQTDTTLDELYDQGRVLVDDASRKEIYAEVQRQVIEQAPISYLYTNNLIVAHNSKLTGLSIGIFGNRNWKIHEWKLAD